MLPCQGRLDLSRIARIASRHPQLAGNPTKKFSTVRTSQREMFRPQKCSRHPILLPCHSFLGPPFFSFAFEDEGVTGRGRLERRSTTRLWLRSAVSAPAMPDLCRVERISKMGCYSPILQRQREVEVRWCCHCCVSVFPSGDQEPLLTRSLGDSLKQAQELAAQNMTPEVVAAKMSPEETKRLSTVRNIGIAVCYF